MQKLKYQLNLLENFVILHIFVNIIIKMKFYKNYKN